MHTFTKMRFFFILLLALGFCFLDSSCTKSKTIPPPDLGYNYYPGKVKSYIIYDVDSTSYNQLPIIDTVHYKFQIKEEFDTLFQDNQNRPTLKLIRYKKIYSPTIPYSLMTWTIEKVWAANITNTDVEVVEDNLRYTKLAFPARLNITWDGNAHNILGKQDYFYSIYDSPNTINGNSFQQTCTVNQIYTSTAINFQNYFEVYARNVGLIYKEISDYTYYQTGGVAYPGQIYTGIHYVMQINSYGTE